MSYKKWLLFNILLLNISLASCMENGNENNEKLFVQDSFELFPDEMFLNIIQETLGEKPHIEPHYSWHDYSDKLKLRLINRRFKDFIDEYYNLKLKLAMKLMDLVASGSFTKAKKLIDNGLNVNHKITVLKTGADGITILMLAALKGKVPEMKFLIENGAKVNDQDNYGFSVLMYAAASNQIDKVRFLILEKVDVNLKSNDGLTALDLAQNEEVIELLKIKMMLDEIKKQK